MFLFGPQFSNSKALLLKAPPGKPGEWSARSKMHAELRPQHGVRFGGLGRYIKRLHMAAWKTMAEVVNFLLRNKHINQAST